MKLFGIELNDKERDFLFCEQAKGKELKVIDGKVIAINREITESEKRLIRIEELKQLLKESDYKTLKFIEGRMSIEEYQPISIKRQEWRDEINNLEHGQL